MLHFPMLLSQRILKIRRGVIYVGIAFSFGMMCLFQLSNAVQSVISLVRGDKEPKKKEEGEE